MFESFGKFLNLSRSVVPFKINALLTPCLGNGHGGINILLTLGSQLGKHAVRSQTVFDEAIFKGILMIAENVTQVVGVCTVREHVGDLEFSTSLGVGITRHDNGDFFTTQIIRPGLALVDTFNLPLSVTETDEFLQKLRVSMLNVIEVNHHVIPHFKSEI